MIYKYISDSIVSKIDDDGISRMSCSIEHPEYLAWLSEGNEPLPADPVPADPVVDPIEKLRAFLAANPDVAAVL